MDETEEQKKELQLIEVEPSIVKNVDTADLEEADYELLVQMGLDVSDARGYASWVLGKLGSTVMRKYGDLKKYAQDINHNYFSIQTYTNVYRKYIAEDPSFSPQRYNGSVPWGALVVAAGVSKKPAKLIEEIQTKGEVVTQGKVSHQALEDEHGHKIPDKPRIRIEWNEEIGKYEFSFRESDFPYINFDSIKQQMEKYLETVR